MFAPFRPLNEEVRLSALRRLNMLDTPPEPRFDEIVQLARQQLDLPMASIGLVDSNRVWIKSRDGFPHQEIAREFSFSGYSILRMDVMHVPDTLEDGRFAGNPLVVGDPYVRMFASCPLHIEKSIPVGALVLCGIKPRMLTAKEIQTIKMFALRIEKEFASDLEKVLTK